MSGFGSSSFGAAPYGLGTPEAEETPSGKALALASNPAALRAKERARYIDPVTRQFQVDEHGQFVGMDAVQQQVYLALRTIRGEAIPEQLGTEILSIQDIGDDFEQRVRQSVDDALARLVKAKLVRVDGVDIDRPNRNAALIRVRWTNLATLREFTSEA